MNESRRSYDKPAPNDKMKKIALYTIALCILAVWLRIGWVLWYPYEPLIVHGPQKVTNVGKQVKAGGVLILESHFTKNTTLQAYVTRQFVNKFVYYVASSYATLPPQKNRKLLISVPVPAYAALGMYRLYNTYTYRVSNFPKRDVTVTAWSEEFEVVK